MFGRDTRLRLATSDRRPARIVLASFAHESECALAIGQSIVVMANSER